LASRVGQDPQKAFTVGLLSLFEALMDMPMEVLFAEVPFQEEIRLAVIGQSGPLGKVLNLVLLYERGDWEKMPKTGDVDLFAIYREALGFVQAGNSIA